MKYKLNQFENESFFNNHNVGLIYCDEPFTLNELDSGQFLICKNDDPVFIFDTREESEKIYFKLVEDM